ncbi:MAG TPA: hypothetical protein VG166_04165 [Caulobacteraceae bacterium]|jgi:hypothetical protein|nr:hypothetical protein [Caulobacteraceae bacterium]
MDRPRPSKLKAIFGNERVRRLAPFFALGPISGPLTAGVVYNLRGGRPVLAGLYSLALGLWLVVAPAELAHLLPAAGLHFF